MRDTHEAIEAIWRIDRPRSSGLSPAGWAISGPPKIWRMTLSSRRWSNGPRRGSVESRRLAGAEWPRGKGSTIGGAPTASPSAKVSSRPRPRGQAGSRPASLLDERLDDPVGDDSWARSSRLPSGPRDRSAGGLDAPPPWRASHAEIARAFLVPEPTVAQRIVRAKRTLAEAKVPFEVPRGGSSTNAFLGARGDLPDLQRRLLRDRRRRDAARPVRGSAAPGPRAGWRWCPERRSTAWWR